MNDLVTFSRVLADTTRWRIVRLVLDDALCVCELADILNLPQSTVSSHVQIIRRAGLLKSEKCEKWTYFRIAARFRRLISHLEKFFPDAASEWIEIDGPRSTKRLEERESSCCPRPKSFRTKRILTHLAK